MFPETGEATIKLLRHFGVDIKYPKGQTCCGKPADSGGYTRESRKAAEHFISVFGGSADPIVIPSGSCASMVKNHYPELFNDNERMREKAEAISGRTYELTQFLVHVLHAHEKGFQGTGRITVPMLLASLPELGVREEPLLLLHSIKGAEFVPFPNADRCCGFGGIFMAKQPEISMALADEKLEWILSTAADTAGCDHGCLMNIADAGRRNGSNVKVKHIAAILAESLA